MPSKSHVIVLLNKDGSRQRCQLSLCPSPPPNGLVVYWGGGGGGGSSSLEGVGLKRWLTLYTNGDNITQGMDGVYHQVPDPV